MILRAVIVAEAFQLSFLEYSRWMALPTVAAAATALAALYFLFSRQLSKKLAPVTLDPRRALLDVQGACVISAALGLCLASLSAAPSLGLPMWATTLGFAVFVALWNAYQLLLRGQVFVLGQHLEDLGSQASSVAETTARMGELTGRVSDADPGDAGVGLPAAKPGDSRVEDVVLDLDPSAAAAVATFVPVNHAGGAGAALPTMPEGRPLPINELRGPVVLSAVESASPADTVSVAAAVAAAEATVVVVPTPAARSAIDHVDAVTASAAVAAMAAPPPTSTRARIDLLRRLRVRIAAARYSRAVARERRRPGCFRCCGLPRVGTTRPGVAAGAAVVPPPELPSPAVAALTPDLQPAPISVDDNGNDGPPRLSLAAPPSPRSRTHSAGSYSEIGAQDDSGHNVGVVAGAGVVVAADTATSITMLIAPVENLALTREDTKTDDLESARDSGNDDNEEYFGDGTGSVVSEAGSVRSLGGNSARSVASSASSFRKPRIRDRAPSLDVEYMGVAKLGPATVRKAITFGTAFAALPFAVIPFIVCMFVLVEALVESGWVGAAADVLASLIGDSSLRGAGIMLSLSTIACNAVNNQPMTILATRILLSAEFSALPSPVLRASMFATIAGSNLGANVTLIGALAGVMWIRLLREKGVQLSFAEFSKAGIVVMAPVLVVTTGLLGLTVS